MTQPAFILASASPQRRRLLEQMGLVFEVRPIDCDEDLGQDPVAERLVGLITRQKMAAARAQLPPDRVADSWILCSDTLVSLDHHRLGKPADLAEAGRFLDLLSGRTHEVLTGVCLSPPGGAEAVYACSTSHVSFRRLSPDDRQWYLDSGEWDGAAGGYRIQGRAACLIEAIRGSYTGIVGLPIELVYGMLRQHRFFESR
jgi:septum formation protein